MVLTDVFNFKKKEKKTKHIKGINEWNHVGSSFFSQCRFNLNFTLQNTFTLVAVNNLSGHSLVMIYTTGLDAKFRFVDISLTVWTLTFTSDPVLIPAFTPAQTLLTLETSHMHRRDLATNPEKRNKPVLSNRSKQHFAADAGEKKILFEGAAFRSIIRGAQNIAGIVALSGDCTRDKFEWSNVLSKVRSCETPWVCSSYIL